MRGSVSRGIGIVFIGYAFVRHRRVEKAIARGECAPSEEHLVAALAAVGVLLGVLVLVIVATQS